MNIFNWGFTKLLIYFSQHVIKDAKPTEFQLVLSNLKYN